VELKDPIAQVEASRPTVLPRGIRLGYGRTAWPNARVARLFDPLD